MIRGASNLRDWAVVFSGDDALDLPSLPVRPERIADESDTDFTARKDAWEKEAKAIAAANREKVQRAIETGDWQPLLKPGSAPTYFHIRQIPGHVWRAFPRVAAELGATEVTALAFRMGVVRIENAPHGLKCETASHLDLRGEPSGIGAVLRQEVTDALDAIALGIVSEVGKYILERRATPPGN